MNARSISKLLCCLSLSTFGVAVSPAQGPTSKIPEVPVARPVVREVTDYEAFSGRTEAVNRIDLRCRVSGYLLKASFVEGADVKKDDVLFEIDPRQYRAEMDRAEAVLGLAEAKLKLAEANFKRATDLVARGAISQEEFNKLAGERAESEASIRVARSNSDLARLNLEFTRVLAPIAGRIGRRLVDPGNLVKADETPLAVLVSRAPMNVSFDVDERTLFRVLRSMRDKGKPAKLEVAIARSEDNGFPQRGVVDFVDNQVDPATGSMRLRAVVDNKDGFLTPGMFVRIRLALGPPHHALLIPTRAVMVEEGDRFVFVVNDANVLAVRPVKLGRQHDDLRTVEEGLKEDDRVVIRGLERLRAGMKVQPQLDKSPERQQPGPPDHSERNDVPLSRGPSGAGLLVEAVYRGANATVVSESVRGPLEQMVGGMERLRLMRSRCTKDGRLTIALTFARDVDLQGAQMLTQNRVNLALANLPDAVKHGGVSLTQGTSGPLVILNLSSPDGRYDAHYLGNYATFQLKDEWTRVAGVGETRLLGQSEYALRVSVDPSKLAERQLNAGEVSRLVAKEVEVGATDQDKLASLILKADGEGRVVRLKDIARIEQGASGKCSAVLFDGQPSLAFVIYTTLNANAKDTRNALRKRLAELRDRLPDGMTLEETFDFATKAECHLVDLDLPISAIAESAARILNRCENLLRRTPEVEHVLALSENPFDLFSSGPCVLVRLTPVEKRKLNHAQVIDALRTRLAALEEISVRIRDLSQPTRSSGWAYPIDLALDGPEAARIRDWASEVGARLLQSKKLTDVWVNRDASPRNHLFADVDRVAAAARGVSVTDIMTALQMYRGAQHVGEFHAFGRNWRVELRADMGPDENGNTLRQVKIRNSRGLMVPLSTLVSLRETTEPLALHFLDGRPMVEITANSAPGVSLDQGRKLCEAVAEEARTELGLGNAYRLTWLQDR
jgi:RND family efflux transporter MFP subunit